jgi:pyroglutamyl-peptidase
MGSRTLLVTGFEPFDRFQYNTSAEVLAGLPDALEGWVLAKRLLPVVWGEAGDALLRALDEVRPAVCVCLGMAPGPSIRLERLAANFRGSGKLDNAGANPDLEAVVSGAPPAYFSALPLDAMLENLRAAGFDAAISGSAGDFLCNEVYYRLMHTVATTGAPERGGFVHIPVRAEDGGAAVAHTTRAVRTLLAAALREIEASAPRLT